MKYIELAKGIKMLQKDRFYAILIVIGANSAAYWVWRILEALK